MSYQGAIDYIKAGRERGLTDADIASRLRGVGWRSADVQDAFALMASMGRVPTPVARLSSVPAVMEQPVTQQQPTPQPQPTPKPIPTPEPQQPPAVQAPVVPMQTEPVTAKKSRTISMQWVGWIAIVITAFVLGYLLM